MGSWSAGLGGAEMSQFPSAAVPLSMLEDAKKATPLTGNTGMPMSAGTPIAPTAMRSGANAMAGAITEGAKLAGNEIAPPSPAGGPALADNNAAMAASKATGAAPPAPAAPAPPAPPGMPPKPIVAAPTYQYSDEGLGLLFPNLGKNEQGVV